jgi:hypothetical protein
MEKGKINNRNGLSVKVAGSLLLGIYLNLRERPIEKKN